LIDFNRWVVRVMSYLQCPECRLTVPALAYYLRGDECPRCMTLMTPRPASERFTRTEAAAPLQVQETSGSPAAPA
jgi:hypothetical protein